jgi:hypothetical protein
MLERIPGATVLCKVPTTFAMPPLGIRVPTERPGVTGNTSLPDFFRVTVLFHPYVATCELLHTRL